MDDPKGGKGDVASYGAGAGGGTLLLVLAQNMRQDHPWRSWLIILAPASALAIRALFLWVKAQSLTWWNQRRFDSRIKQTRTRIDEGLANPHSSDEHKRILRERLEKINLLAVDVASGEVEPRVAMLGGAVPGQGFGEE